MVWGINFLKGIATCARKVRLGLAYLEYGHRLRRWDQHRGVYWLGDQRGDNMSDYIYHVTDGHRHVYDQPRQIMVYDPSVIGMVHYRHVRVSSHDRRCKRCGFTEYDIGRIKRGVLEPPPPKKPEASDQYKLALDEAKHISEQQDGGLNNFSIIYEGPNGYGRHRFGRQPCYGTLTYDPQRIPGKSILFVDRAGYKARTRQNIKLYPDYSRWLYTLSPYRHSLVNTWDHYRETGVTIHDMRHHPAQYVVASAMCFRYLGEHINMVQAWDKLVKAGVDPNIAFVMVPWITVVEDNVMLNNYGAMTGHTVLDNGFGRVALRNYLMCTPVSGYVPMSQKRSYMGMMKLWGGGPRAEPMLWPDAMKAGKIVRRDSMGRKKEVPGISLDTVRELQYEFLKLNGVTEYEPEESFHSQRRPSVRSHVQVGWLESAAQGHVQCGPDPVHGGPRCVSRSLRPGASQVYADQSSA